MGTHPVVEVPDVSDGIHNSARLQDVCVFSEQSGGDDPCLVLPRLEVRVGKEEEESGQGVFWEVIGHELHRVCADNGDVLVWTRCGIGGRLKRGGSRAESHNPVVDILRDLNSDLHT